MRGLTALSSRQSFSPSHLQYDLQDSPAVLQRHLLLAQGFADLQEHATDCIRLAGATAAWPYSGWGTLFFHHISNPKGMSTSGGSLWSAVYQISVWKRDISRWFAAVNDGRKWFNSGGFLLFPDDLIPEVIESFFGVSQYRQNIKAVPGSKVSIFGQWHHTVAPDCDRYWGAGS